MTHEDRDVRFQTFLHRQRQKAAAQCKAPQRFSINVKHIQGDSLHMNTQRSSFLMEDGAIIVPWSLNKEKNIETSSPGSSERKHFLYVCITFYTVNCYLSGSTQVAPPYWGLLVVSSGNVSLQTQLRASKRGLNAVFWVDFIFTVNVLPKRGWTLKSL